MTTMEHFAWTYGTSASVQPPPSLLSHLEAGLDKIKFIGQHVDQLQQTDNDAQIPYTACCISNWCLENIEYMWCIYVYCICVSCKYMVYYKNI